MTDAAAALLALANAGDLAGYADALTAVPVQRLQPLGKDVAFHRSLDVLAALATATPDPAEHLTALALIGRADSTTQQKHEAIADAARRAIRREPPPIGSRSTLAPDDRYYLALVLARADALWVTSYAARALVDEGGEPRIKNDIRTAFADVLFARAPTLGVAYAAVAGVVEGSLHENPGTKEADLSRARRLVKLLPVLEEATRRTTIDSGPDLLEQFNAMLQRLMFRYGRPPSVGDGDEVAGAAVDAALLLLSTLLRTRFVLAVETDAYLAVGRAKYWHRTETWPRAAKGARRRLGQTLVQAITLRAKTGSPSRELLKVLVQLSGDRRRVDEQLAAIADEPGVAAADVQDWLRAGGRQTAQRFVSDAAEEAGLRDVDALIATAAVRAAQVQALVDGKAKAALAEVREAESLNQAARSLTQGLNFARALSTDVQNLLRRRSMALFGVPDELEEAVRDRHRREDGRLIETALVQIQRPGVERQLPNGKTEVILPAMVVEAEGRRK